MVQVIASREGVPLPAFGVRGLLAEEPVKDEVIAQVMAFVVGVFHIDDEKLLAPQVGEHGGAFRSF